MAEYVYAKALAWDERTGYGRDELKRIEAEHVRLEGPLSGPGLSHTRHYPRTGYRAPERDFRAGLLHRGAWSRPRGGVDWPRRGTAFRLRRGSVHSYRARLAPALVQGTSRCGIRHRPKQGVLSWPAHQDVTKIQKRDTKGAVSDANSLGFSRLKGFGGSIHPTVPIKSIT
jgi:hypothetical protein